MTNPAPYGTQVLIRMGETITCAHCQDRIATVKRDLYQGDVLVFDMFNFLPGQMRTESEPMNCVRCGGPWGTRGALHVLRDTGGIWVGG